MKTVHKISLGLKEYFNEKAEAIARSSGFIKRRRKITGSSFIKAMVFGHLEVGRCTIENLCEILQQEEVTITRQGVDFRFNEAAVKLIEAMCYEALRLFRNNLAIDCQTLACFKAVKLLDSSYITLPNSMKGNYKGYSSRYAGKTSKTESALKMQLLFDYLNQTLSRIEIKQGASSDQGYRGYLSDIAEGDLVIADLGYFVPSSFQSIVSANAYFISRYKADTNLYDVDTGEKIELLDFLKDVCALEKEVLLGKEAKLKVRLIAHKLSKEQSEPGRRKANKIAKCRGYKSSQRNQNLLDWSIFITNVSTKMLSASQLLATYRVRWQIELLFKLYKSHIEIDKFKSQVNSSRVLCEFYAKLSAIAIFHGIANCIELQKDAEFSLPKAMASFKKHARELLNILHGNAVKDIVCFIANMLTAWSSFALKDQYRKKRLSTLQSLNSFYIQPLT